MVNLICCIDPNSAEPWNEWWVRLELQKNTNQQLEQQRKWLELELESANEKMAGAISEAMNFDLDSLSEVFKNYFKSSVVLCFKIWCN